MFQAEKNIGPADAKTNEPTIIGQNALFQSMESYRIQHPNTKLMHPILRVREVDIKVYILMLMKYVGIAMIPKQSVQRFTYNKDT